MQTRCNVHANVKSSCKMHAKQHAQYMYSTCKVQSDNLSDIFSDILTVISPDILSDILSGISSNISSDILSDIPSGPVANTWRRVRWRTPGENPRSSPGPVANLAPTIAIELGVSPILIAIVSSFPSPLCTERTCMLLGRRGGGGGAGGGGGMCLTSLVSFFQGRIKACRKIFECLRMQIGLKPHYGDPLAVLRMFPNDQHKTSSHSSHCSKFSNFIEVSNSQRCEKMFQRPHHQSVLLHVLLYLW